MLLPLCMKQFVLQERYLTAISTTVSFKFAEAGGGKKLSRRIIANRESAQRSRLRKLQYIADLEANIAGLNSQASAVPMPSLTVGA